MSKWKLLDFEGTRTLAEYINKAQKTADGSSSAVSQLGNDLQNFSQLTTSALEEMASEIEKVPVEDMTKEDLQKLWDDAEIVILPPEEIPDSEIEQKWNS